MAEENQSLADAPEGAEYEDYSFEDSDYVEEEEEKEKR